MYWLIYNILALLPTPYCFFFFFLQLIRENEELTQHLNTSRESQSQLKTEVRPAHLSPL